MSDTLADPAIQPLLDDDQRTEFIAACERVRASLRKAIEACDRAVAEIERDERESSRMRHLFGETGEGE